MKLGARIYLYILLGLAVGSSLFSIASAGLYVDSLSNSLVVRTEQPERGFTMTVTFQEGSTFIELQIDDQTYESDQERESDWEADRYSLEVSRTYTGGSESWLGFGLTWMEEGQGNKFSDVLLPLWMPVLIFACISLFMWLRWIKQRVRRRPGHCRVCGYNLIGNESGACPECGKETGARTDRKPANKLEGTKE